MFLHMYGTCAWRAALLVAISTDTHAALCNTHANMALQLQNQGLLVFQLTLAQQRLQGTLGSDITHQEPTAWWQHNWSAPRICNHLVLGAGVACHAANQVTNAAALLAGAGLHGELGLQCMPHVEQRYPISCRLWLVIPKLFI
jgi:hypothetical protein